LRQLRAFIAISEAGNFTTAASRLGVSQSSLSVTIQQLETNIGLRLFDRHTRKVVLTDGGLDLVPRLKRLLSELDQILRAAGQTHAEPAAYLRIATTPALSLGLLPGPLGSFAKQYSLARVAITECAETQLAPLVRAGQADFAIGTAAAAAAALAADLEIEPLRGTEIVAAFSRQHRLAAMKTASWRDIGAFPLVIATDDSEADALIRQRISQYGGGAGARLEVSHVLSAIAARCEGDTVAIVFSCLCPLIDRLGLRWRRIRPRGIAREIALIRAPDRPLSTHAEQFRQDLFAAYPTKAAAPPLKSRAAKKPAGKLGE
jgi:DNA-binding transcriptional LysR family regulator